MGAYPSVVVKEVVNVNNDNIQGNGTVSHVLPPHIQHAVINTVYLWIKEVIFFLEIITLIMFLFRCFVRNNIFCCFFKYFCMKKKQKNQSAEPVFLENGNRVDIQLNTIAALGSLKEDVKEIKRELFRALEIRKLICKN
uniref:Uncharacterized protein n=1 Tax=Strongyloides venezuelensis TaxID=75913 RepID=A0A0K0FGH6_STRVS